MAYNNDSGRRSAVSSFYGGRKSSIDALNNDNYSSRAPAGPPPGAGYANPHRDRADSSSTFFGPQRSSRADMVALTPSAGYNRQQYFDVGREAPVKGVRDEEEDVALASGQAHGYDAGSGQDDPWDVYADFNNAGPRYSTAFGKQESGRVHSFRGKEEDQNSQWFTLLHRYYQLPPQGPPSVLSKHDDTGSRASSLPVELVTVPALGSEWRKEELKNMTAAGRKEGTWDDRKRRLTEWRRDQRGCCGKWGTRKQIVIGGFILIIVVGITLVFTIPRVPSFSFNGTSPLLNATDGPAPYFSRAPANFTFEAIIDLEADAGGNYLPLKFNHIDATVFDLNTNMQVATGNITDRTIQAHQFTDIQIPLNFSYLGSNDSDPTWLDFYNACKNPALNVNDSRPGLDIRLVLEMSIAGLVGSKSASTQINSVNCPFELPENSV